jgi:hypothetical protein
MKGVKRLKVEFVTLAGNFPNMMLPMVLMLYYPVSQELKKLMHS